MDDLLIILPDWVIRFAKEADNRYPNNIQKALNQPERNVREHPNFSQDVVDRLVSNALRRVVHNVRHVRNRDIKRCRGEYGAKGGKFWPNGKGVQASEKEYSKWFDVRMGGKRLGSLLGKELPAAASLEHERSLGHSLNESLIMKIIPLVPDEKTVEQAIKGKKMDAIAKKIYGGQEPLALMEAED